MDKSREEMIEEMIQQFGTHMFEMDKDGNIIPRHHNNLPPGERKKLEEKQDKVRELIKEELERREKEFLDSIPPAVRARMEEILIEQEAVSALKQFENIEVQPSDVGDNDPYMNPIRSGKLTYTKMRDLQADKAVEEMLDDEEGEGDTTG